MNAPNTQVFRPYRRFDTGFLAGLARVLSVSLAHTTLLKHLVAKQLFAPYKRSFLGSLWVVISPVAAVVSWVLLQVTDILKPGDVPVPYPVYVLVGTLLWTLFMRTTTSISTMLLNARHMISHVAFPHEILPIMHTIVNLANFGIAFVLGMGVCLLFGIVPSAWTLALPVLVLPLLLCSLAIGLIAAILSPISYDLSRIITAGLGLLMFVSPVIYSRDAVTVPWLSTVVRYNPLTYLVSVPRDMVLLGSSEMLGGFAQSGCAAFILFALCWRAYFVTQDRLTERLI